MELLLVFIIIGLSIGYAGWRVYRALTAKNDPCAGCSGCALSAQMRKKAQCEHKK